MFSIEFQEYQDFMQKYRSTTPKVLRLGQAFHQHFSLEKSTQNKALFDQLYQLDGFNAIAFINHHFKMD